VALSFCKAKKGTVYEIAENGLKYSTDKTIK
jgi:hypothetical protein